VSTEAPRICLSTVTYPPGAGGVAVAAERLARLLATAGYEVHVLTLLAHPGARGEVAPAHDGGVWVHRVLHEEPFGPHGLFALRQFLQQLDDEVGFSLFHGFFLTAAYPCLAVARRGQRPLIASIRGSDVMTLLELPATRALILPVLRGATWITSVNHECLVRVAGQVPVGGRSSVIRSGVERPGAMTPPWSPGAGNRGVVGTVGELRKVKDIPLLIRAYATLPVGLRRGLLLAGFFSDDDEEAWSTTLIEELGIARETTLTGRFPNAEVSLHLGRMHVYVQSSASEGLPNALLEAALRGVPIVATAVGGMKEVLVDGRSALLVPHGDRDALGRAIGRVLGDDVLARRLSAGGRELATLLSPERERDDWLALYRRLLEQPAGSIERPGGTRA
jgi:glycosyltransferase involved in cell wall biosynthesis